MKKSDIISLMTVLVMLCVQSVQAEIKLPAIVSSNMVLQRNTNVTLWGWANAKEDISIEASWLKESLKVKAGNDGSWRLEVKTTGSKEPQSIRLKSKSSDILLENILFGEVWLCSGQSNMQQPVNGYGGQPTFGTLMTTAKAGNPNLRLFTVNRKGSKTPENDVEEYIAWQEASPESVPGFSAVAYYFGKELQEVLDVPVGMIHTSWGGSSVQAWISEEVISEFQQVNLADVDISKGTNQIPTVLFNAMINPLVPFTIKGALWYQGESNRFGPENYKKLFPAMVKDWRQRWNIGDFPFYYVQIAPYWYNDSETFSGPANSAYIRETQLQCVDLIPNSGIAITMDIGDQYCIHPPKKKEVADRLLFIALNQTYGFSSLDFAGPVFHSMEEKDGGLVLKFKHAESGLFAFDGLSGFEIAGDDRVFHPAEAHIDNHRTVYVRSDNVPDPVAVRYAWDNWVIGTLYDTNLLPASSFRTDDWTDANRAESVNK